MSDTRFGPEFKVSFIKTGNTAVPFKVGDRIIQWCFGEEKAKRMVLVTSKHEDVKNGRSGFDGTTAEGYTVWGYDSEVKAVL
jgi:dUTPase